MSMYSPGDPVIPSGQKGIGDPSRQRLFIVQVKLPLICKGSPENVMENTKAWSEAVGWKEQSVVSIRSHIWEARYS